jgi:O-antigen ligase
MFFWMLVYLALVIVRPQEYPALVDAGLPLLPATLGLAFLFWLAGRKSFAAPQYLLIVAFLAVIVLSEAANGLLGIGIEQLTRFAPTVLAFVIMANAATTQRRVLAFMAVFAACSAVLALHGIEQKHLGVGWTGMPLVEGNRIQYIGIFSDPNDLGLLFVAALPMAWHLAGRGGLLGLLRLVWLAIVGMLLYGVYLTNSRGALLGVAAMVGVYVWRRFGVLAAGVCGGAGLALMSMLPSRLQDLDASESSAAGRVDAWYEGFQMFAGQPLFGVGAGNFTDYNYLTAHNSFVLVLSETGYVGFTIWLAFVGYCFIMMYTILRHRPPLPDAAAAAAWKNEQSMGLTLLVALIGFFVAAFFLSRSYVIILYLVAALVVGNYTVARGRFPTLPVFSVREHALRWMAVSAIAIVVLYVLVRVLL